MPVKSVKWHEECLVNMKRTSEREKEEISALQTKVYKLDIEIFKYENQIARAKKECRSHFDNEKYNIRRSVKGYTDAK